MSSVKSTGPTYWRSLDEVADTPEFRTFMHREFPAGASELLEGTDRRGFLRLMGASMALAGAGLTGCRRWPKEHIAPYAARPEGMIPGKATQYASIVEIAGVATGILATTHDGRPTKLEGNPGHPGSLGALTGQQQAMILDLYDPDRSRGVLERPGGAAKASTSEWKAFGAWWASHAASLGTGKGLWFIAEPTGSPSLRRMQRAMRAKFPDATWVTWDPLAGEQEAGLDAAMGGYLRPVHDLSKADVIVSLESDFLCGEGDSLAQAKGWASNRTPDHGHMSRVLVLEPGLTVTGSAADDRWGMKSTEVSNVAAHLAAAITGDPSLAPSGSAPKIVKTLAAQLNAAKGRGLVIAGRSQPAAVHHLTARINEALGNTGTTVKYVRVPQPEMDTANLAAFIAADNVDTVVIIGGNPVYDAPADMDLAGKLKLVSNSVHLSSHDDETSRACRWHLTRAHALESWGDGTAWDGTVSVQQPMILPLFGGQTPLELLAIMAGEANTAGFDIVRRTFQDLTGQPMTSADTEPPYDPKWRRALHAGVIAGTMPTAETPPVQRSVAALPIAGDDLELNFTPSYAVGDGRFANNGWMQEFPDPLTKLTWDNAFLMHPADADAAGVSDGDVVSVTVRNTSIEGPVIVQPGQTKGTMSVALGWGRTFPGRVSTGAGFDAYRLRTSNGMWAVGGVKATATGGSTKLARTQDHFAIDSVGGKGTQERLPVLFREGSLDTFNDDPAFAQHMDHSMGNLSLWQAQQFDGADYAWGMTIDLNKCIGCGDCVIACQAENNIPIVGKDQVIMGREMHWLRIDRYYRFKPDSHGGYDVSSPGTVAMQPMMCQQCENAPCEQVCPVAATVHTTDGLNAMVYNRCVGTRYCSNNCPYKVRRFNFFDYFRRDPLRETGMLQVQPDYYVRRQSGGEPLRRMQFNPNVTVRMRGVMEKCTWCTQRIEAEKILARNAWVKMPEAEKAAARRAVIPDGSITPACAQTCSTDAIIFGDLMDADSKVTTLQKDKRAYALLSELHIKPRNKFLARLSNPIDGERYPEDHKGHGGHGGDGHGHDNLEHGHGGSHG